MDKKHFDVIIIGGGAGGLFLACELPHNLSVAIVEANDRVGKKLLATGNGKCNLSNLDMNIVHYNKPSYVEEFLDRFDAHDTVVAFDRLGLQTKVVDNRVYPYSESATNVLDILRKGVERSDTEIFTSHIVTSVENYADTFTVSGVQKEEDKPNKSFTFTANCIVLATGSPATFGRNSLDLYTALGHTYRGFVSSLTSIKTDKEPIKSLQGIRVKAGVRIGLRYEVGEVLFKDFGISGIAVFNMASEISRGIARIGGTVCIDFMPDFSQAEVEGLFNKRANASISDVLSGIFHSKVCERIIWASKCNENDKAVAKASAVAKVIKNYPLKIEGLGDVSISQVMSGGLNVKEFDENLMSIKCKNAYAIGEVLDVDGDSGGYNLQWAWTSAKVVTTAIAKSFL